MGIELNKNLVNAIRKISQELRKAKQNIDDSYSTVVDLKENADNYNTEKIGKYSYELADKFNSVEVGGKRVEETVVYAAGYQPRAFSIPPLEPQLQLQLLLPLPLLLLLLLLLILLQLQTPLQPKLKMLHLTQTLEPMELT